MEYIDINNKRTLEGRIANSDRILTKYVIIDSGYDRIATFYKIVLRNLLHEYREERLKKLLD